MHCRSATAQCPQAVRQCIAHRVQWTNETLCDCARVGRAVPAKCGSALVRLCNNTLTHSAHATHTASPVYLYPWVDIPAIAFW